MFGRPNLTSIKTHARVRGHSAIPSQRSPGPAVATATTFTDPVSVETWDACFRWRVGDALRDVTIDDTWRRVAEAVASPRWGTASMAARYEEAFARWRLLPDERLLRCAGTANPCESAGPPAALVNVGAFVDARSGVAPRFHRKAFMETATLAVRLLDDALGATRLFAPHAGLRIGIVGFGDALARLGVRYETTIALDIARAIAIDLAEGCLHGSVALARERGPFASGEQSAGLSARLQALGMPASLVEDVQRHGLRHVQLTSIERHPLLARLANNTSDALAPVALPPHATRSTDPALTEAERAIATAMQPWIDVPIGGDDAMLAALVHVASHDAGTRLPV